jgi:hypothetical protein
MKLGLTFCFLVCVAAITQEEYNTLVRWGLCFAGSITPGCAWVSECSNDVRCENDVVTYMRFEMPSYVAINATDRQWFSHFPNVTYLHVNGGWGYPLELYPELGYLTSLQTLSFNARISGTIPNELGALTNLSTVQFRSMLTGTIPAAFFDFPMRRFEIASSDGSDLQGPTPNYRNAQSCQISRVITGVPIENPSLFCSCNSSCSQGGGYNRCSVACGTISTATCNEAIATLGYGYVCYDACRRCGAECSLNADRSAYRCPNDPPPPPPRATSESSRTTPIWDGTTDEASSNGVIKNSLF